MLRLGVIVILLASRQFAQAREPADWTAPIPPTVSLQAPGGHFKNFTRRMPCRAGSFRTTITIEELRRPERAGDGAAIQVYSDNIVRSFYIDTDDLDVPLEAKVTEHIDDLSGRITQHHMNVMFKIGEPARVEVVWTSKEVAFFLRERKLWTFKIPPPTHLILMTSGAVAKFDHNSLTCDLIS